MEVKEIYSHKGGMEFIQTHHAAELEEIYQAIQVCDAVACLSKLSKEKTKPPLLFSPVALNKKLKNFLSPIGWTEAAPESGKGFSEPRISFGDGRFREMDGIKNKVGLEIQFGKYAFMGYDIFSKMPLFAKKGLIECGVEIVGIHSLVKEMSTGVSSFDQITIDMEHRGVADIDIPTLVIGIGCTDKELIDCVAKRVRFSKYKEAMLASGEVSMGNKGEAPGPKGENSDYQETEE
jgi:hypothetical protein